MAISRKGIPLRTTKRAVPLKGGARLTVGKQTWHSKQESGAGLRVLSRQSGYCIISEDDVLEFCHARGWWNLALPYPTWQFGKARFWLLRDFATGLRNRERPVCQRCGKRLSKHRPIFLHHMRHSARLRRTAPWLWYCDGYEVAEGIVACRGRCFQRVYRQKAKRILEERALENGRIAQKHQQAKELQCLKSQLKALRTWCQTGSLEAFQLLPEGFGPDKTSPI